MAIKNIILDFGHGGINKKGEYTTAPAKMFKFNNGDVAYEGVLNRQIGGFLELYLKMLPDYNIITTVAANDPRDISLGYRVRKTNSYNPAETIFISIHCNASKSHRGTGFEIFTTKGFTNSDKLAEAIYLECEELYRLKDLPMRSDTSDGDHDKEVDYYVLRKTKCPAVLIECGFFDNVRDFVHLRNPYFQAALACQIYNGIIEYIENN